MYRLLGYIKPYSKTLLPLSIVAVLVATAIRLIVPILTGVYTLDHAIANKDTNLLIIVSKNYVEGKIERRKYIKLI